MLISQSTEHVTHVWERQKNVSRAVTGHFTLIQFFSTIVTTTTSSVSFPILLVVLLKYFFIWIIDSRIQHVQNDDRAQIKELYGMQIETSRFREFITAASRLVYVVFSIIFSSIVFSYVIIVCYPKTGTSNSCSQQLSIVLRKKKKG